MPAPECDDQGLSLPTTVNLVTDHLLLTDCPDRPGLVHQITGALFRRQCNIVRNQEFVDSTAGRFFMRTQFSGAFDPTDLEADLRNLLGEEATIRIAPIGERRIVVMATREHHCLGELLMRHSFGELGARIEAVISNHPNLGPLVERFEVPFHSVPHHDVSRDEHEERILVLLDRYDPEYIVLAKYMRVLSPPFIERYRNRIINIHHSFLPAFPGARPYQQAFDRGVKIIGATAHFVTQDLDEGPIIAQDVIPVDHRYTPEAMARAGRDVEKMVLVRGLSLVLEERVFLNESRTIIFD
jgi:formyltetrahydrofolate deformylase